METSYLVAYGSACAGVKISVVVPDQRKVPFTSGVMWNQGMVRFLGILPTATIGPLKTTRISFASASVASSPIGPALTMVIFLVSWAWTAAAKQMSAAAAKRFMRRSLTAGCGIVGDGLWRECGRSSVARCRLPVASQLNGQLA